MSVLYIRNADGAFIPIPTISGKDGLPGKTAYQYAVEGGYKGTEAEFAAKLAQEIPEAYTLPVATPYTLGGVMIGEGLTVDEDGRVSVDPEGEYELINSFTVSEDIDGLVVDKDATGAPLELSVAMLKITCDGTVKEGAATGTIYFSTPSYNYFARVYASNWKYPGTKISETAIRPSTFSAVCDCSNGYARINGIYGDEQAMGNVAWVFSGELYREAKNVSIIKVSTNFAIPANAKVYLSGIRKVNTND